MEEELRKLHPQRPQRQLELEPRSRRGMVVDPRVSVIHEGDGGPGDSEESDSDGPILYRDDDEDDEDVPQSEFVFSLDLLEIFSDVFVSVSLNVLLEFIFRLFDFIFFCCTKHSSSMFRCIRTFTACLAIHCVKIRPCRETGFSASLSEF